MQSLLARLCLGSRIAKWWLSLVCCSISLLGGGTAALAEEIHLVTGEFAPYSGEHLPNGGMLTDLVAGIFYQLGYAVSVTYLPWKRGYQQTLSGKFTATFPYSFSTERAEQMLYSAPLRSDSVHLFVHVEAKLEYAQLADLRGARLCTALGYNLFPQIEEALNQRLVELITVREMDSCVRMMENRRADGIFLSEQAGWSLIEMAAGSRRNYRMLEKPIHEVHEYLLIAKDYPGGAEILKRFNQELARRVANGDYQRLAARHGLNVKP